MAEPLLAIRDLEVTYRALGGDVTAVRGFTLDVAPGEAVAIVGESGSGKSTVALAVLGLLDPRRTRVTGSVRWRGRELLGGSAAAWQSVRGRDIGLVFQDPLTSLNPYLTIGLQVAETILRHEPVTAAAARARAVALLTTMEVRDADQAFRRYPHEFSGGMRQRALIASALSAGPALLIADEPTTALDVITQARVLRLLRARQRASGLALLLITHDLGIVAGLCDRVAVVHNGELVESGPARTVYATPQQDYTRRLLAAVPRVDAAVAPPPARSDAGAPLLTIRGVTVRFARPRRTWFGPTPAPLTAVADVTLDVQPGEVLGLVGQSGSGKSTLLRAVAGLARPAAGEIRVGERRVDMDDAAGLLALRREVQMIFQNPLASLNPRFTAERILTEPMGNLGIATGAAARAQARELLALVNLDPAWASRYPHELSGGQCQRLGMARALATKPRLLLCDEPVSALDVSIQAEILDLLRRLRRELGLTLLFVSHDLAVVRHLADRVAVMHQGRIVELQSADRLYAAATHPYTRTLLAAVPVPDPAADWLARALPETEDTART